MTKKLNYFISEFFLRMICIRNALLDSIRCLQIFEKMPMSTSFSARAIRMSGNILNQSYVMKKLLNSDLDQAKFRRIFLLRNMP